MMAAICATRPGRAPAINATIITLCWAGTAAPNKGLTFRMTLVYRSV